MKKTLGLILIAGALLAGCFPEGEGHDKLIIANNVQGPAGGERLETSAPSAPYTGAATDTVNSAFPANDLPSTGK